MPDTCSVHPRESYNLVARQVNAYNSRMRMMRRQQALMHHNGQQRPGSRAGSQQPARMRRVQQPRVQSSQQSRRLEMRMQAVALQRTTRSLLRKRVRRALDGRACAAWLSPRRAAPATAARMRDRALLPTSREGRRACRCSGCSAMTTDVLRAHVHGASTHASLQGCT